MRQEHPDRRNIRIGYFSDSHREFWTTAQDAHWSRHLKLLFADCDLILAAGDIDTGIQGPRWLDSLFPNTPTCTVMGNHESYGGVLDDTVAGLRAEASRTRNVRFLENESAEFTIRGRQVRVLGCTLWTDYKLLGEAQRFTARQDAVRGLNDFRMIRLSPGSKTAPSPLEFESRHEASLAWLKAELDKDFAGDTIILTHHAPSEQCSAPVYRGDPLSPAFCSNLESFVEQCGARAWISGHTHFCNTFTIGTTLVTSSQFGYLSRNGETETGQAGAVIEV